MNIAAYKIKVLFRVDSSSRMGNGHLMRCIALAEALRDKNCDCFFLTRDLEGSDYQRIINNDFDLKILPRPLKEQALTFDENNYATWAQSNAKWDSQNSEAVLFKHNIYYDWLVIDNYSWGENEHKKLAQFCKKIMIIDDLENRHYYAHMILDSGAYDANKYDALCANNIILLNKKSKNKNLNSKVKFLIGPKYLLLNKQFVSNNKNFDGEKNIKRICIVSGATDPNNINNQILKALVSSVSFNRYKFTFVLSVNAPHRESLKNAIKKYENCTVLVGAESLVSVFLSNDLLITACGGTLWEGAILSCPMAIFKAGKDQHKNYNRFIENKAAYDLASAEGHIGIEENKIKHLLELCYENSRIINRLGMNANRLCDGQGSDRVANAMLNDFC